MLSSRYEKGILPSRPCPLGTEREGSHSAPARGLPEESGSDDLKLGIVMHDGTKVAPFWDHLFAAPMSCLWLHAMEPPNS